MALAAAPAPAALGQTDGAGPAPAPAPPPPPEPPAASAPGAARAAPLILYVDPDRVIEASAPAAALRRQEAELRARLEAQLARVKAELEAEELELSKLRDTLARDEFNARALAFDRRVRRERAAAQERGAMFVRFVNEARAALASALPRVIEALRRERGAAFVLNAGAALAADPALDATDEAVRRFDAAMDGVTFDPPAELLSDAPAADDGEGDDDAAGAAPPAGDGSAPPAGNGAGNAAPR
ncbi:OmpH family outer membrane protein [Oceanicella actignis]|uniref:OmpH family outer membrane protein n=1 Tax=Oceanicella actignis TaxID=1189325 RepID=UPI000933C20B|nr:OmpH family outer membrane protein [Oceanicella actignis]